MEPLPNQVESSGPQQTAQPQGQAPVIIVMQAPKATKATADYAKYYPSKAVLGLSITQIVAGVLSIIFQIVLISNVRYGYEHVGQGIWCGFWYILSGSFGVASAKRPNLCTLITVMILTIISACMSVPYIVLDGIGFSIRPYGYYRRNDAHMALFALMFILGLAAGISAIVVSALTCRTTCCKTSSSDGAVMYNPTAMAATAAAAQHQVAQNMNLQQQPMMGVAPMGLPPPNVPGQNPPPYNYQIHYPVTAPLASAADAGMQVKSLPGQENLYSAEPSTKNEEEKGDNSTATKGDYNRFF